MTKSDLVDHLCSHQKMAKGRAEQIVNAIFDSMEEALKLGERIEIRGLGSFEVRSYKAYEGRNPRTGSAVAVKPKRLPFFKVGKELKERVNMAHVHPAAPAGRGGAPEARGGVRPEATRTERTEPARTATAATAATLATVERSEMTAAATAAAASEDTPLPRAIPTEIPGARI
jgi:integration host factor subunit beta